MNAATLALEIRALEARVASGTIALGAATGRLAALRARLDSIR